jgi:hypothetical protein
MTQYEQAGRRTFPTSPVTAALAALAAAAAIIAIIAAAGFAPLGALLPGQQTYQAPQSVVESGRYWEQMRLHQMGVTNPVTESGQDWEQQRRQQGVDGEGAVTRSGIEWERQRLQQSGIDD